MASTTERLQTVNRVVPPDSNTHLKQSSSQTHHQIPNIVSNTMNNTTEPEYFDSAQPDSKTKKRRRSRKGLEKTFACEEPDCGKKFTRLEHLSRHHLNRMYYYYF